MSRFAKWLLGILIIGGLILPMFVTGPSGRPIMSLQDWLQLNQQNSSFNGADAMKSLQANTGQLYKWRDQQGRWHFSSEPPADQQAVAAESLPELENVMAAPSDKSASSSNIGLSLEHARELVDRFGGDAGQSQ